MAKYKYEELEVDEHDLAIHWRDRNGDEYWAINEYKSNGEFKNVHITHMYFPAGYVNSFDHKYEKERHVYYEYDENFNITHSRIEDTE